jgi:hypothetical protein
MDILQKIIQHFSREGRLKHPLVTDLTCPVIQYADDTLIVFQGEPQQARILKEILEAFSLTTRLMIIFDKSTLVPINLDNEDQMQISDILGCPITTFPQTYLGIPLSDSKSPRWALYPLLHSLDKKVDSLSLSRATSGGCLTLSKSIIFALPSHLLACIKAPIWFYQEIDKRRCAYFWPGQKTTTGARCKIAWDAVCRPIEEGGLNIINLETQNICLLLKFIHKLHMPNKSSWANWILSFVYSGQKRLGDKIPRCSSSWRYQLR